MSKIPEVYGQVIETIREAADESAKDTGFGVFSSKRLSDGEEVYLLAFVEKMDKNGKPTDETEMSIIAEFLPKNKSTKDLYDLKDFWIVEKEEEAAPPPPLPKNVFQFRKKR